MNDVSFRIPPAFCILLSTSFSLSFKVYLVVKVAYIDRWKRNRKVKVDWWTNQICQIWTRAGLVFESFNVLKRNPRIDVFLLLKSVLWQFICYFAGCGKSKFGKRANLVCHSNTVTYQCEEKEWQAL